jgi:hypothetical protein
MLLFCGKVTIDGQTQPQVLMRFVGGNNWDGFSVEHDAVGCHWLACPHVHGCNSAFSQVDFHTSPLQVVHRWRRHDSHCRYCIWAVCVQRGVVRKDIGSSRSDVALKGASPSIVPNNRIERVKYCDKDRRAGHCSLRHTSAEYDCGASAEVIVHDQKRAIVHSSKQGEVFVWETLGFQDIEGRSVIHCVECVLDV